MNAFNSHVQTLRHLRLPCSGHWHFDYIVFLWDLQAACGSEVALQGSEGSDQCQLSNSLIRIRRCRGWPRLANSEFSRAGAPCQCDDELGGGFM